MMTHTHQEACRVCGGTLETVLDLGDIYPSAFISSPSEQDGMEKSPLALCQCRDCHLVQLADTVDLDSMYRRYYYQSGINRSMVAALRDVVEEACKLVELKRGDVVCDIASNDGTLLSFYPKSVFTVGFDPARNLPRVAEPDYFVNDYFSAGQYPAPIKARIVTSIAMLYDLPDPRRFVREVRQILSHDGVWIVQFSDLKSMLETTAFDNLCHEHLEYYSVQDILSLMAAEGLIVFRIEHNAVNGGSLRFYVSHSGVRWVEESVMQFLEADRAYLHSAEGSMAAFAQRIERAKQITTDWIRTVVGMGQTVYGLAASTKGNTLLQYFGIDGTLITAIADLNPDKFGKYTIGTHISILPEDAVLALRPDYLLVLAWHFLPSFLDMPQFQRFMAGGGVLIAPLPEPRAYFMEDGRIQNQVLDVNENAGEIWVSK